MFTAWHLGQLFEEFSHLSSHSEQQRCMDEWIPTLIIDLTYDRILKQGAHLTHHSAFSFLSFLWLHACEHYSSADIERLFTPVFTADLPLTLDTHRLQHHIAEWSEPFRQLLLRQLSILLEDAVYGNDSPFEARTLTYYESIFPSDTFLAFFYEQCQLMSCDFYRFLLHNGIFVHPNHMQHLYPTPMASTYQYAWSDYHERFLRGQSYAPVDLFQEYRTVETQQTLGYV